MDNHTFIFIDGSYYCFYRYFALLKWWNNAYPNVSIDNPYENLNFVEKFKKTFINNLIQIPKKLNIDKKKPIMIVGKDCKREDIWRNDIFSEYKATRKNTIENSFIIGEFFKMVYEEKMFEKGGIEYVLTHPRLEADDCIALTVKYLISKYPKCNIYIITSDKDYLQLSTSNIKLFTLAYKNVENCKNATGNAKIDLQIKILMGDKSDNIPPSFPKCGLKTAQKCIQDEGFLLQKLANEKYYEQYKLNEILINFDKIPQNYVNEFMSLIKKIIKF